MLCLLLYHPLCFIICHYVLFCMTLCCIWEINLIWLIWFDFQQPFNDLASSSTTNESLQWVRLTIHDEVSFECAPCRLRRWKNRPGRSVSWPDVVKANQTRFCLSCLLAYFFLSASTVLLTRATFCVVLLSVICVFCLLVVLVRLSVPAQVIDWKDSSPKWPVMCRWGR